jgi:hypothetical protein
VIIQEVETGAYETSDEEVLVDASGVPDGEPKR